MREHTVVLIRQAALAVAALAALSAGCPRPRIDDTPHPTATSRAVPIPAAASRSPDLLD